jgi:hypothetical protein
MPVISDYLDEGGLGAAQKAFDQPYHEYWFHLGRFIHGYAMAEARLLFLLWRLSGTSRSN